MASPYHTAAPPLNLDSSTPIPPASSDQLGIRIGNYTNCTPIGSGVTSEVYRAGPYALKVIVAVANLEPHNPHREAKILSSLRPPVIPLLDVFRDHELRLVLRFPYMPLTLADLLDRRDRNQHAPTKELASIFRDVLRALEAIHHEAIIHRDMKPSAVLLQSPSGPAFLSDFGTAWHPHLSASSERPDDKILDIGTGPYRAPEVLFGDKAYGTPVDMWALGVMIAEAVQPPSSLLFESRPVSEDGNQLGLILSIFKTLGTPTPETWPEAKALKVSPFELWTVFPPRPWPEILPDTAPVWREAVAALVTFHARATASEAYRFSCFAEDGLN
ncbi:hypothetical protein RJ55_04020 [Drechmeria coniospora]|nr:hypothetical protein RJ55_04020 [Drechmeria coniospora]